jgi:F0F1-type ATP synthase membrane subunit b/b'
LKGGRLQPAARYKVPGVRRATPKFGERSAARNERFYVLGSGTPAAFRRGMENRWSPRIAQLGGALVAAVIVVGLAGHDVRADPAIAAADKPHEEVVEKSPTAEEELRLARKLEREAASHRRTAEREYRKQAADYRRAAAQDRSKAQHSARLARVYQRLAQKSLRRGA